MYEQYPKDERRVTEVYCYKITILYVNQHNKEDCDKLRNDIVIPVATKKKRGENKKCILKMKTKTNKTNKQIH